MRRGEKRGSLIMAIYKLLRDGKWHTREEVEQVIARLYTPEYFARVFRSHKQQMSVNIPRVPRSLQHIVLRGRRMKTASLLGTYSRNGLIHCEYVGSNRKGSRVKKSKDFSLIPYQCLKCDYQWIWRRGNTCPQEHCRSTKISKRLDGGEER